MNILGLLEDIIVIYIVYKVVFGFIIPLFSATKQMKGKVDELNRRMQQEQQAQADRAKQFEEDRARQQYKAKAPAEDYIDYEEIKG